jgi:hypothetical protein
MSDETTRTGDSAERAHEKRDEHREAEERKPAAGENAGKETTEEGLLEGVPASDVNRPTG